LNNIPNGHSLKAALARARDNQRFHDLALVAAAGRSMPVDITSTASRVAIAGGRAAQSDDEAWEPCLPLGRGEGMLKLGTPVRYQGHWGRVIARTFGRERLYDLNLADGSTLRYVCESDLEIIPPASPPDPASDQAIEAGLTVLPDPDR
jgi:hypothetical protein